MNESHDCVRELIVNVPADQVWEWLSDLRNCMTSNQFHKAIDCDDAVARGPKAGMDIPILHVYLDGSEFYRIARVMKYEDYELSWAERVPDDAGYEDTFPHGEGWKVESIGTNQCLIKTSLYGSFRTPVGRLVGQQAWDAAIPTVLDNDLQDVAFAVGAVERANRIEIPPLAAAWLRLANARVIDGIPAEQFLNLPNRRGKRASAN